MRKLLAMAFAITLCGGFIASTACAFDIPKPKKNTSTGTSTTPAAGNTDNSAPPPAKPADNSAPPAKSDDSASNPAPAAPAAGAVTEMKLPKSAWDKWTDPPKAGDWVVYSYPAIAGYSCKMEVLEVGDHFTVTKSSTTMAGNTSSATMKMIYSEPDPKGQSEEEQKKSGKVKEFSDTVDLGAKGKHDATRYESYGDDGKLASKAWICKDLPMGGMCKSEDGTGKVMMLITDYGRK